MYRHALVTTDGSDIAATAFPHAAQVVAADGKITVVEVVDDVARVLARTTPAGFEFGVTLGADLAQRIVDAQRTAAQQHVTAAKEALTALGVADIETAVLAGLPGDEIVTAVTKLGCDVVVMATHGRSGLSRTVLGSVADYVVRHLSGTPVVLIRPPEG